MRIRSLNLHHWGPIKQLETQFNPEAKIIVLHATNGAGKSTFIRAIGNLLSWHRGGNTWGAQESISTGEESATLEMIVENSAGEQIELRKTYQRDGKTLMESLGTAGTLKHSDKIRAELIRMFGADPQDYLNVLIAKQQAIGDLLHADPAVREREFLKQVNLTNIVEAEAKLLECSRTINLAEGTEALQNQAEENLAVRKNNVAAQEKSLHENTQTRNLLEPLHQAYTTWQTVKQQKTAYTAQQEKVNQLTAQLQPLIQKVNERLGTLTRDGIPTEQNRLVTRQSAIRQGQHQIAEIAQYQAAGQQYEQLERSLTTAKTGAAAFGPEQEAELAKFNATSEIFRATMAQERSRQTSLNTLTQTLTDHPSHKATRPQLEQRKQWQEELLNIERRKAELGALHGSRTRACQQHQTLTNEKNRLTFALQATPIATAPERMAAFDKNILTHCRKELIQQTLSTWGTPGARCPVSFIELSPQFTDAKARAEQALRELNANVIGNTPKADYDVYLQLSNSCTAITAQIAASQQEIEHLNEQINKLTPLVDPTQIKSLQDRIRADQETEHHFRTLEVQKAQLEQQLKTTQTLLPLDLAVVQKQLDEQQNAAKKLEEQKAKAAHQAKEAQTIEAQRTKLQPYYLVWNRRQQEHQTWRDHHPDLLGTDLLAELENTTRHIGALQETTNLITDETRLQNDYHREAKQLAELSVTPDPAIPLLLAESGEPQYQSALTQVNQTKTLLSVYRGELALAEQAVQSARQHHTEFRHQRRIKDALLLAASKLNYEQIPRLIVQGEFNHILGLTNTLLRDMKMDISLSQQNFEVFASLNKPGLGMVYNRASLLSGGEKTITGTAMRLAAKRRLAAPFNFMILDEPSTSVAQDNMEKVYDFMLCVKGQLQVLGIQQLILSDHHPKMQNVADQIITW